MGGQNQTHRNTQLQTHMRAHTHTHTHTHTHKEKRLRTDPLAPVQTGPEWRPEEAECWWSALRTGQHNWPSPSPGDRETDYGGETARGWGENNRSSKKRREWMYRNKYKGGGRWQKEREKKRMWQERSRQGQTSPSHPINDMLYPGSNFSFEVKLQSSDFSPVLVCNTFGVCLAEVGPCRCFRSHNYVLCLCAQVTI